MSEMRRDIKDDTKKLKFLKDFRRNNNILDYKKKIKELIKFEIELLKNNRRIEITRNLNEIIRRGRINRDGNKIKIEDIHRYPLSKKNLKINSSFDDGYDISIQLTPVEISKIEMEVNEKYTKITQKIDRELMPPPSIRTI